jgi:hypothetical protein
MISRETEELGEKPASVPLSVLLNHAGLNLGLHGEKPASSCLSHVK